MNTSNRPESMQLSGPLIYTVCLGGNLLTQYRLVELLFDNALCHCSIARRLPGLTAPSDLYSTYPNYALPT